MLEGTMRTKRIVHGTRRQFVVGAAAVAAAALMPKLGFAAVGGSFTKKQLDALERISSYFNQITTLSGNFIQVDSFSQEAKGKFFFRRPGRLRFEYVNPPNLTIITDGTWYMVNDTQLKTVDRYPLASTPINIFLKKDVDLAKDERVKEVKEEPGLLTVVAREEQGLVQGELHMTFAAPSIELRKWTITDAQGITTTVALTDLVPGGDLSPELFVPVEVGAGRQ